MSNVLSKESKKVIYKTVRTLEGIRCEVCGKIIPPSQRLDEKSRYFEVITGHYRWGNDSCDSIKTLDICPECICAFTNNYLNKVQDTYYIEIRTTQCVPHEVDE